MKFQTIILALSLSKNVDILSVTISKLMKNISYRRLLRIARSEVAFVSFAQFVTVFYNTINKAIEQSPLKVYGNVHKTHGLIGMYSMENYTKVLADILNSMKNADVVAPQNECLAFFKQCGNNQIFELFMDMFDNDAERFGITVNRKKFISWFSNLNDNALFDLVRYQ